jgi:hypothetical protein
MSQLSLVSAAFGRALRTTHITSKVLLLAQDGLVPIELTFEEREVRIDTLLVYRLPEHLLERCLSENVAGDRVELSILHARRLLESRTRPELRRDQLRASSECGEVAADSARLEELEAILHLLDK